MHRLQFHYTLSRDASPALVRNPLIDLLQAVSSQGSISAGARALGLSYRHVWGALKRWENELGNELVVWEKGQSARLTEFGAKLLWAERQAQARLAPQIEALRSDLERVFAVAFDENAHVVTLYASHDDALTALREEALAGDTAHNEAQLHLDIRFCGSVDAIRGLNEGRCVMAGFHTLQHPAPGSLAERVYKPLLQPGLHKIIGFAERTQGLMVAPGNPLRLRSLADLANGAARFVNRTLGTGTRVVLDELLAQQGLTPRRDSWLRASRAVAHGGRSRGGVRRRRCRARYRDRSACARSRFRATGARELPPGMPEVGTGGTGHRRAAVRAAKLTLATPAGGHGGLHAAPLRRGPVHAPGPAVVEFSAAQEALMAGPVEPLESAYTLG